MRINIKMKDSDAYDCVEILVWTVASFWGREHELMFIESWRFFYERDLNKKLGKCINTDNQNKFKNLTDYHGIQVILDIPKSFSELWRVINEEINKENPIGIFIDTFWCPWHAAKFQKTHSPHYALVIGTADKGLLCIDSQMAKDGKILTKESLEKGWKDCLLFRKKASSKSVNAKEILEIVINNLTVSSNGENQFDEMINLSNDIVERLDLKYEVEGAADVMAGEIFQQIFNISRGRKQFAKVLAYFSEKMKLDELLNLSYEMTMAGNKWNSIYGMLIKLYYLPNENEKIFKERISQKISKVSEEEKQILDKLIEYVENDFNALTEICLHAEIKDNEINEYIYLNLEPYFNNKGIGTKEFDCKAELSPNRGYFLEDNFLEVSEYKVENDRYKYFYNRESVFDNICCRGQVVQIPRGKYKCVMILGCAELGNHIDDLIIRYEDSTIKKMPIQFTSWFMTKGVFGEKTAVTTKAAVKSINEVMEYSIPVHLYSINLNLDFDKKIDSFELPYCDNIHIFSITLGK